MIVRDEASSIRETLESVRDHVDSWLVLDTGSTDGTQAIVREVMAAVPGELAEETFVDYGATRNRALDIAGRHATFTLMLSGDERLEGGASLRRFCEERRDSPEGAYYLQVAFGPTDVYDSARLARTSAGWRYEGATHEVLVKDGEPPPTIRVPGATIVHAPAEVDQAARTRRWEQDLEILRREQVRQPDHGRTAFYLAQTYECLGRYDAALYAYKNRVSLGGWREEVYESLFRIARCADKLEDPWCEVQHLYLQAHAHSPERAEPLYAVAKHWYDEECWPLAYLFGARGAQLPPPTSATLFVDKAVYEHRLLDLVAVAAYHVGEYAVGYSACQRLMAAQPGDPRHVRNLAFYVDKKPSSPRCPDCGSVGSEEHRPGCAWFPL